MSRFAIGERVDRASDGHEAGIVCAVFPTVNGNFRYAVDMEGYGALAIFQRGKTGRPSRPFQSATGKCRIVNAICSSGSCRQFSTIGR